MPSPAPADAPKRPDPFEHLTARELRKFAAALLNLADEREA